MKRIALFSCLVVLLLGPVIVPLAHGHEFVIKPVMMSTAPGSKLPLSVVSCHVFIVSEEMEPLDKVEVKLVGPDDSGMLKLVPNEILMTLDGRIEPQKPGTMILTGHRKGVIWTNTTQGWKQAGKKGLSGVISSSLYEKFAKTIIKVGAPDNGYSRIIGHTLEIVPACDLSKIRTGDYAAFKVLYQGQPLATTMWATFDGFTPVSNTYAYYTETGDDNLALVKITHPGTWLVKVEKIEEQGTEDYDKHVIRAVLVFEVK